MWNTVSLYHGIFLYGFNSLFFCINPWILRTRYSFLFFIFHKCVWCACVCRHASVVVGTRVHLEDQGCHWESSFVLQLRGRVSYSNPELTEIVNLPHRLTLGIHPVSAFFVWHFRWATMPTLRLHGFLKIQTPSLRLAGQMFYH